VRVWERGGAWRRRRTGFVLQLQPANATRKELQKEGQGIGDLDLVECNEASRPSSATCDSPRRRLSLGLAYLRQAIRS
jgi:hypothetical protein